MTVDEWFKDKFNLCYLVEHLDYPDHIFMFYDQQYIRKMKLSNITKEVLTKTEITGYCLFDHDLINMTLYCNPEICWTLTYKYSLDHYELGEFFAEQLKSILNIYQIKRYLSVDNISDLEEYERMKVLSPYQRIKI